MKFNNFRPLVARASRPCVTDCYRTGETPVPLGNRAPGYLRGFTIIEIALCLGIIGFALVAIIGALPTGLNVQKQNREQTIIGQDGMVLMDAIRSGARGFDDLANYVICITNVWTTYNADYTVANSGVDWYTPTASQVTSVSGVSTCALTNGARIIGLLSMPKFIPPNMTPPYQSNYVIAYFRSFSGAEVDKIPQSNPTILADAFIYRMIVENYPYAAVDTNSFCIGCPAANGLNPFQIAQRKNMAYAEWLLQTNTQDFRLRFRWPVLPNGQIPNYGEATFRQMATGQMTNYLDPSGQPLYFVQPSVYAELPNRPSPP